MFRDLMTDLEARPRGYFGAGLGIMRLAALGLAGMRNLHAMNALKVQLVTCNNAVSAGIFLFSGLVPWPQTLAMMAGAVLGGWAGSRYGRRLPAARLRWGVVAAGLALSACFFFKTYAAGVRGPRRAPRAAAG